MKNLTQRHLSNKINTCLDYCKTVWENAAKYKVPEVADEMEKLYGALIDLSNENRIYISSFLDARDVPLEEKIAYHTSLGSETREAEKQRMIDNVKADILPSEEIVEDESDNISLICPLIRDLPMVPVISSVCKHVYEEEAILNYLKSESRKCPVSGCSKLIRKRDIMRDENIKVLVERTRLKMKRGYSKV